MKNAIAVWGGPDSGKTTLSLNLAKLITNAYGKSVLIVSAAPFSEMSGIMYKEIPEGKGLEAALKTMEVKSSAVEYSKMLFVLGNSVGFNIFDSAEANESSVRALLRTAGNIYDYIIIDCTSDANSIISAVGIKEAGTVVLCTGGDAAAIYWAKAFKPAIRTLADKIIDACIHTSELADYKLVYETIGRTMPESEFPFIPGADEYKLRKTLFCEANGKANRKYIDAALELLTAASRRAEASDAADKATAKIIDLTEEELL